MDEAGAVVAGQRRVVVLQQSVDRAPPIAYCVVDHVVTGHVYVKLHPVHLLWQVQDIYMDEREILGAK